MGAIIQTIVLATLTVCSVRCHSIPSSFEKTILFFEQTNQEKPSHSFDGSQPTADIRYPLVSTTVNSEDDELSTDSKTLALQATVYHNLAPLVQLAAALPDMKPFVGLTKMKSGYSKVTTTTVLDRRQGDSSDNRKTVADSNSGTGVDAAVVTDGPAAPSVTSESALGKSIEKSKEVAVGGGGVNSYRAVVDDEEEDEDVETIVPGRGGPQYIFKSAKEVLAEFLRKQRESAAATQTGGSGSQPMAAKLIMSDGASAPTVALAAEKDPEAQAQMKLDMERQLKDFMEKVMSEVLQAKMHEVRVEQRPNGLQQYSSS